MSYKNFCRQARKGNACHLYSRQTIWTNLCEVYHGRYFCGIEVVENIVHTGIDGRRYLVVHGEIFDFGSVTQARWLALLGDKAYELAPTTNRIFNAFRRVLGAPYWSVSSKWC